MTAPDTRFPPPSGAQYEITHGPHQAVVTEVGATLRAYTVGGADVIDGFPVTERSLSGRGQVLAPWPNRLGDGRYDYAGRQATAALNEPGHGNAIHGLVRWAPWHLVSQTDSSVVLGCVVHPQPAYPWRLELRVGYGLGGAGLTVTADATNLTEAPAPFGIGFHPYLTAGTPTIDSAQLLVPARSRLVVDERGLPTGDAPVVGTPFGFTGPRPIGPTKLDTAYANLTRADDGLAYVRVDAPVGTSGVTLWSTPRSATSWCSPVTRSSRRADAAGRSPSSR